MSLKLNTASGGSITLQEADTASNLTLTVPAQAGSIVTADSSGNVGIGVTPNTWSYKSLSIGTAGTALWQTGSDFGLSSNAYNNGGWKYNTTGGASLYDLAGNQHIWYQAASGTAGNAITFTQAMTLDASGNLLVGSSASYSGTEIMRLTRGGVNWFTGPNSTNGGFDILRDGTTGVYLSSGATSWAGLSDETMKDIIEPITNASEKVASLRTVIGKYKTDEEGVRRSFLIAQDVQAVLPEAVNENQDGKLGLQYTDVIPLLVAAIKEQQTIIQTQADTITAMEARLTALENK